MATAVKRHEMFIGGEWVQSVGDESLPVVNAATGETIAEIPRGTEEDVERAVAAARVALDEFWFDTTPGERQRMRLKLADAIDEPSEEIGRIESENVGKPLASVMRDEMPVMTDHLRFFAGAARVLRGVQLASASRLTSRSTRACSGASPSAWWDSSRRGTTRCGWPSGSSVPLLPRGTRS